MLSSSPASPPEERESEANRRGWLVAQAVVLGLAGFIVFAPVLHGNWIWDDKVLITNHPVMADPGGWWKLWFAPPGPDYFPLTSTVEWVLWHIFGDHTLPFHLVCLLLHLASALLLWRLFVRLGLRLAWLGALLFVVHPLAVESVAWITELKNTVSLPLLLLSMLGWLRYEEHGRPRDFALSLFFFLVSMLAKTSVVMLPVVLLLYTWWKHGRVTRQHFTALVPFFLVALVLGVVTVGFQLEWAIGGGDEKIAIASFPVRVAGAGWAVFFYLGKFLWPVGLHPVYPQWSFNDLTLGQFLPWPLLLVVAGWIWWRRQTWGRPLLLGGGFFLLNLVPALGFLPMAFQRFAWVADQFVYLPMIGLIGLTIGGVELVLAAWPQKSSRTLTWGTLAALILFLTWQSRTYAESYRSELALWSYAQRDYSANRIAHYNLAFALVHADRIRESIPEFEASLAVKPDDYTAEEDLGTDYDLLGEPELAIVHYNRSLKIKPSADAYASLGVVLLKRQQYAEAARQFEAALQLKHNFPEAEVNLGNAYVLSGRLPDALAAYQTAARLKPDYASAYFDQGSVLAALGRTDEAIRAYEADLRLDPNNSNALKALASLRQTPAAPPGSPP